MAERGVIVSRETIRLWVNRFGVHFAACICRGRPRPNDKWHMDEVVVPINGVKHWLWRAVDANGDTLDILVQTHRNARAARRFLARLIDQFGSPRVVITDKLRSYIKPIARKASTTGLKAATGRPEGVRKSWEGSNHPGRRSVSSPPMSRSTPSSNPAAIASPPDPIVMQEQMPSAYGPIMPARWSFDELGF